MVLFHLTIVSGVARQATAFNPRPALKRLQPLWRTRPAFTTTLTASSSSSSSPTTAVDVSPVPMTLLSGFLGTGKTTTLKHLLENTQGLKIGVVVNDVASVNIDAKLVASESKGDMVELQNGCACCSIADELFTSVERLCKNRKLDAIVVELSGVADPKAIQNNWKMAPAGIREIADIAKIVTVVDAQTFGTDFMTWDMAQNRQGWVDPSNPCSGNQKVSELLAEQVEAAHVILVNKADLATQDQVQVASKVASALNDKAILQTVTYGNIAPMQLIGMNIFGQEVATSCDDPNCQDPSHNHTNAAAECDDPHCSDASHDHSHAHESHKKEAADCTDPDCTDESHHHHHHSHAHAASCNDPDCTDPSHNHEHAASCNDPNCDDPSHSHSHSHATSTDSLGISNFVYKAQRPFNSQRLMMLLNRWPVPKKDVLDMDFLNEVKEPGNVDVFGNSLDDNPFLGVLRSKGFTWLAPTQWSGIMEDAWRHDTAMYMSHAGRHMSIDSAGRWWATIPREQMDKFFDDGMAHEKERILKEDFVTEEFGDRRQEIVFIGMDIDQQAITSALDNCLLTDEEMETYRQQLNNYQQQMFSGAATSSVGLMDTTGTQHMDQAQQ